MLNDSLISNLTVKLRNGVDLLKRGHFSLFWNEVAKRSYSTTLSFGLSRNLHTSFVNPNAKISIKIREFKNEDIEYLFDHGAYFLENPRQAEYQLKLVNAKLPTCYVAVNENDEACYMQWLIGPGQNHRLRELFGDTFPQLRPDEALLEAAFMSTSSRGLRIMPAAMSRIAVKAKQMPGVKTVTTYVDIENIPSLKGCKRAGFSPFLLRKDEWLFFNRYISFSPLPADIMQRYHEVTE